MIKSVVAKYNSFNLGHNPIQTFLFEHATHTKFQPTQTQKWLAADSKNLKKSSSGSPKKYRPDDTEDERYPAKQLIIKHIPHLLPSDPN